MKKKPNIIVVTSLISLALVLILSYLQSKNSNILNLEVKWLLVSGIPLILGLFLSGAIKSFKGFGVELETNLAEKVEIDKIETVESTPSPQIEKESPHVLEGLSEEEKSKLARLQLVYGKKNYYSLHAIRQYLQTLENVKYIEIIGTDGKFVCLLSAAKFKEGKSNMPKEKIQERIKLLVKSIEEERVLEEFNDVITETVKKGDSLLQAFRKFNASNQGWLKDGEQNLPVVDSNGKMIGISSRNKLANKIAEQVLASEK